MENKEYLHKLNLNSIYYHKSYILKEKRIIYCIKNIIALFSYNKNTVLQTKISFAKFS